MSDGGTEKSCPQVQTTCSTWVSVRLHLTSYALGPDPVQIVYSGYRTHLSKRGFTLTSCTVPAWTHANPLPLAWAPSQSALVIVYNSRLPYTMMQVCGERRWYRNGLSASPNRLQHVGQRSATPYFIRARSRPGPNSILRLPRPSL